MPDGKGALALHRSTSRCANGRGVEFLSVETGVVARLVGGTFSVRRNVADTSRVEN